MNMDHLCEHLAKIRHSPLQNYIAPGLRSSMIGGRAQDGSCVRLFESERDTREHWITPHSHTFDFTCLVIDGMVENIIFQPINSCSSLTPGERGRTAQYSLGYLHRDLPHSPGQNYRVERTNVVEKMVPYTALYKEGECYRLEHDEVHSIRFFPGAKVLFFEGATLNNPTVFLEPWVEGYGAVPTFKVEPWMFARSAAITGDPE